MDDNEKVAGFTAFYEGSKQKVFRAVLLARAGDRQAAEDAVADAYERAYLRWEKLAEHPNPTAWVIRTAMNQRISMWRRQRRVELGDPEAGPAAARTADFIDPALMEMVRALPRGQREVLALRVLLDFSTEQTADALGIKQGTVKAQLHRALQALRPQVAAQEFEEVCPS
jgi:RNA polymerase sigma factor (sigma-70 family)